MLKFLQKRWFLIALVLLIVGGMTAGRSVSANDFTSFLDGINPRLKDLLVYFPQVTTAMVLFLMSFSLDSSRLKASFRSPNPVLWASAVNFGVIPLLAWPLMSLQNIPDFGIGLMIAASVPCTIAAASVWTRRAGGNDAVSLMVSLMTNGLCFAITPFWLNLTTGNAVKLDVVEMVIRLVFAALLPTLLGQVLRQFSRPAAFATRYKTPIGVLAQVFMLGIVLYAACRAGNQLTQTGPSPGIGAVSLVWGTAICVHLLGLFVGVCGAKLFGFDRTDQFAVAFASSQKTLPIGVLLATDPSMFGNLPFAVFPMLMYHVSQLFIDTAIADRMAGTGQK